MRQAGLTLVEVLVGTLMTVLVGGLLLAMMVNTTNIFHKESAKVSSGLNANDATSEIRKSVKIASAVDPTSTPTKLVLKVSSLDSSGNMIFNVFDSFVLYKDETNFRFKILPDIASSRQDQDRIFATEVDSLIFQYYDLANPPNEVSPQNALKVRATLTLKARMGADYETTMATTEAVLRND